MARVKMITRTVEQTTAKVMCLDVRTAEVTVCEYTVGGNLSSEEALAKLKSIYDTDTLKLVHVEETKTEELLLGMPEEDFIKYAQVLPPRQNKTELA